MSEDNQMLNPRQVAEILGVHQKTVHLWLRSGRLQGVKISYRAWRIPQSALDSFLASNSNTRFRQHANVPKGSSTEVNDSVHSGKQSKITNEEQNKPDASPQSRMKHYIRDIMGEQTHEE